MEITRELSSVQQNRFPETQLRRSACDCICAVPLQTPLCCHDVLAPSCVPLGAAMPPEPDTTLCRTLAPLAWGPWAAPTPAPQEQAWAGATGACRAGFFPKLDRVTQGENTLPCTFQRVCYLQHEHDNTSLLLTELHRLHCYQLLLQYSSKYMQIKETSGAEVQTPV